MGKSLYNTNNKKEYTDIIDNKSKANEYYNIINNIIEKQYLEKWKINPINLKKYLRKDSKYYNNFLIRNSLDTIKGIKIVLDDVLDDITNLQTEKIKLFNHFLIKESKNEDSLYDDIFKGIEKPTIEMEKIIADLYDTNLGEIDIIDTEKHIFEIKNWKNKTIKVSIFTKDEMDIISTNIIDYFYKKVSNEEIKIHDNLSIDLKDLINKSQFNLKSSKIITKNLIKNIINTSIGNDFKYKTNINDCFIWDYKKDETS